MVFVTWGSSMDAFWGRGLQQDTGARSCVTYSFYFPFHTVPFTIFWLPEGSVLHFLILVHGGTDTTQVSAEVNPNTTDQKSKPRALST
jgi:hypothetical protein